MELNASLQKLRNATFLTNNDTNNKMTSLSKSIKEMGNGTEIRYRNIFNEMI